MTCTTEHERSRRCATDDGAALVEFTLVSILLLTLVFGIISFGLILSFKQDMTRAAAEGARAGAVAVPVGAQTPAQAAREAAHKAVKEAVIEFGGGFAASNPDAAGKGCQRAGMSCPVPTVAPCAAEPAVQCVTVTVEYDYDTHPLFGRVPLIEQAMPNRVAATSVARIND